MTDRTENPDSGEQSALLNGRDVFDQCIAALCEVRDNLGEPFALAVELLSTCAGRVVITGIGKSGHVGRKIASTLSSTGTPAAFLHAGEAGHGDLGFIRNEDICIIISKSGNNEELHNWVPFLRERGCPLIALTGNPSSWLAGESNIVLDTTVSQEACPHNLAPTNSTTAALVMGDALAIALLKRRGFGPDDFLRLHPGGVLGKRLSLRVADLMHCGAKIPTVAKSASLRSALVAIVDGQLGMTCITTGAGQLWGILTDGDLKRLLIGQDVRGDALLDRPVEEFASRQPRSVSANALATDALTLMEAHTPGPVTCLVILDDVGGVDGVIHLHDILRAGLD
ncbi:MAG: KpsF/GutQ family sugar-phosphate isomerase [bacterium]|nr:KpsF/GutQ family sugar-phosphate isomerase [bacterium]